MFAVKRDRNENIIKETYRKRKIIINLGQKEFLSYEKEIATFMPKACHFSRASGTSSKTIPFNSLFL